MLSASREGGVSESTYRLLAQRDEHSCSDVQVAVGAGAAPAAAPRGAAFFDQMALAAPRLHSGGLN